MLLANEQREQLARLLGDNGGGIIRKNISEKDIELCGGLATEDFQTNTCALCVAANKTAYRPNNVWQLTHPNCKCKAVNGNVTVQVDFPMRKLTNYLFTDKNKSATMRSMGYRKEDSGELQQTLSAIIKKQYEEGTYKLKKLDEHGQHVQFEIIIIGKRDHAGEMFRSRTGCVLWPYGKIKVATPLLKNKKIKIGEYYETV